MNEHDSSPSALLLGRDHAEFGRYSCRVLNEGRTAVAISAGADPTSQAMRSKGDPAQPNEDAALALDQGDTVLLAVADAHFGEDASHELIAGLAARVDEIPGDLRQLQAWLRSIPPSGLHTGSSTTLVLAVHDRRTQSGFGISYGDSSLVLVGAEGARRQSVRGQDYVSLHVPASLRSENGFPFHFRTLPGQLILAFTDGIDECHYRSPGTSVGMEHVRRLFLRTGPRPEDFARRLVELALKGVDGNPGGQDNIALAVSSTD